MVAGTIDATACVILWRRELFSNIFGTVGTRKSQHSFRKTSSHLLIHQPCTKKLFPSVPTSMSFDSCKLSLLLKSTFLSSCGAVALSIRSFFMNLFIKTRRTLNKSACKNGPIGVSV